MMPMIDEMESIYIWRVLTNAGYLMKQDGERWRITEPNDRPMPQERRGLRTLRECSAWADGVEAARMATALNGAK